MKKSLFTKIGAIALGLGLLVTGGVSLAHTNVSEAKAESTTITGTYTYDLTTNFSTYAADWTNSYGKHTIMNTDVGDNLPSATIVFAGASKQSSNVSTCPVTKNTAVTFSLTEAGFSITSIEFSFKQWGTKTAKIKVCETSSTGTELFNNSLTFSSKVGSTGTLSIKGTGIKDVYAAQTETNQVGWSSITVTIAEYSGTTPVSSVDIVPGSAYLPVGGTKVVSASVLPAAAADSTVTWSLSDVNPSGSVTWDASTLTLTGVSEGTAKLTATANDGSGVFDTINVNVVDAYQINAKAASTTSYNSLTTNDISNYVSSDVTPTYKTVTNVFSEKDNDRVKFGSSSAKGVLEFTIPSTDNYLVDKVVILGQGFSGDTSTVSVNESEAKTFTDNIDYYVFDITDDLSVNISGTTASKGRFYIYQILLVKVKSSTPLVAIDNAPTTLASLAEGTFTATVTNATTYTIVWTSSDANVIEVQDDGSYVTGEAGKATITATITVNGVQYSDTADIVVLEHDGLSATNAFTTTEAKLVIDNNLKVSGKTYYVTGTISKISYAWSDTNKNLSYIITDGTTEFTLFKMSAIVDPGLAANSTVTAYAAASKLVLYNTTYELNGCTYADPDCTEVEDFIDAYMHMTDYDTKFDNSEGTGACSGENGYYAEAKAYFNDMTSRQRSVFVTGTDYAKAYARLQAWATANGEVFGTDNVLGAATSGSQLLKLANENNAAVIIVMVTAMAASLAAAFYFMLRKKKAQ